MAERRRTLFVNWKSVNGAAQGKRKLVLRENDKGEYTCPVNLCLHTDFKSKRGLRKHIDNKHSWFFYFDKQPEIKREEVEDTQPPVQKKASTTSKPYYSMEEGIGKDFLTWLCTSCGGGKSEKEAKQIAKRALKFLMDCTGGNDSSIALSNELVDCCLGSPAIIIRFLNALEKEWKLSFSSALSYVKAITDLLDFRKANGVSDSNLRCFAVTEVYLRRSKENFRKKKHIECTRNFDLETLVARDSWATLEEMENVIPFHIDRFKDIVESCKQQNPFPCRNDLCFCTRFITTFLFLRVKCSRPMTFQFLTLAMVDKARVNNGFIDQTEFKTASKYTFDTLIITPEVFTVLDAYIDNVRPHLNPNCDYLLVSSNGNQYQSLTTAMTMLVHEAIGKYIHPTRYRQIVETTSAERLSREEQETISEDQKHSSTVAKIYYKKKQSRNVAVAGKRCMEKMLGQTRTEKDNNITNVLSELHELNSRLNENPALQKSKSTTSCDSGFSTPTCSTAPSSSSPYIPLPNIDSPVVQETSHVIDKVQHLMSAVSCSSNAVMENEKDIEMTVTKVVSPGLEKTPPPFNTTAIAKSLKLKKETACSIVKKLPKNVKFTTEEDVYLKQGIAKYGLKSWSSILKDDGFKFHSSRTRDSLRVRADSAAFKRHLKK